MVNCSLKNQLLGLKIQLINSMIYPYTTYFYPLVNSIIYVIIVCLYTLFMYMIPNMKNPYSDVEILVLILIAGPVST
jgi:hypothetical protein